MLGERSKMTAFYRQDSVKSRSMKTPPWRVRSLSFWKCQKSTSDLDDAWTNELLESFDLSSNLKIVWHKAWPINLDELVLIDPRWRRAVFAQELLTFVFELCWPACSAVRSPDALFNSLSASKFSISHFNRPTALKFWLQIDFVLT